MVNLIIKNMVFQVINKNINVKKHEAQPMQACLQSVACRWAKCQLNEVKIKMKNHSPFEVESNEQGFSEVRLVGGLKIMKNLELRIKNLPLTKKLKIEN